MPPLAGEAMIVGENGHVQHSAQGVGDSVLAFFDKLCRGLPENNIREFVQHILEELDAHGVKNLFVLAFQTRWCRGGKGERKISLVLLKVLYEYFPKIIMELVTLLPMYGSWKDPLDLLLECRKSGTVGVDYYALETKVWMLFATQLQADWRTMRASGATAGSPVILSLCAKFAPLENGLYSKALRADKEIAEILAVCDGGVHGAGEHSPHRAPLGQSGRGVMASRQSEHRAARKYRVLLSGLRRHLNITETHMCAKTWGMIDFSCVPSLCLNKHKLNFLDENPKTNKDSRTAQDTKDRLLCRDRILQAVTKKERGKGINSKQIFPNNLVQQVMSPQQTQEDISPAALAIIEQQWKGVCSGLLEMVAKRHQEMREAGLAHSEYLDLTKLVVMSDVSGSMMGTPMYVSIAMGILVSGMTHASWRNKVMTFETNPVWHDLSTSASFVEKVKSLAQASWGGSTDFYAAMRLIADLVRRDRLEQQDIPTLLVVSDMQFNESIDTKWNSAYNNIVLLFHDLGMQVHGSPLTPPTIIFWNVQSRTFGYPASADQKGVVMLSGYSPALMKYVLSGQMPPDITPREMLATVLNDSGLDAVWDVLNSMSVLC